MKTDDLAPGGALSRFEAGHIRTGQQDEGGFQPCLRDPLALPEIPF